MENAPDLIRQQMSETRASLTEKLESLENQMVSTVQGATASVAETVESVKEAVISSAESVQGSIHQTVETVKDTLDIKQWVQTYPWMALGGSVAIGFVLASWTRARPLRCAEKTVSAGPDTFRRNGAAPAIVGKTRSSGGGMWTDLNQTLGSEWRQLKGLALATLFGAARDYVARQVPPSVSPRLSEIMDDMTAKLAGKPVGPILPEAEYRSARPA